MTLIAVDSGRVRVNVRFDYLVWGVCVCVRVGVSLVEAGLNLPLREFCEEKRRVGWGRGRGTPPCWDGSSLI